MNQFIPNASIHFSMCNEFFIYHDAGANGRDKATGVLALLLWGLLSLRHRKRAETNMGRSVNEEIVPKRGAVSVQFDQRGIRHLFTVDVVKLKFQIDFCSCRSYNRCENQEGITSSSSLKLVFSVCLSFFFFLLRLPFSITDYLQGVFRVISKEMCHVT